MKDTPKGVCEGAALCFPAWFPLSVAPPPEAGHPPRTTLGPTMAHTWLFLGAQIVLKWHPVTVASRPYLALLVAAPVTRPARDLTFSCLRTSSCRWRKYWSLSCCFTSWCLSCR